MVQQAEVDRLAFLEAAKRKDTSKYREWECFGFEEVKAVLTN